MGLEEKKELLIDGKKLESMFNRARTFCDLLNKNNFPFSGMMFGFGKIEIDSAEECMGKLKELSEIIGFKFSYKKINDGNIRYEVKF